MIRFLICNIFISIMIGVLLLVKQLLRNNLTNRMHYNLWYLLLGSLAVPFLPVQPIRFLQIFTWFGSLKHTSISSIETMMNGTAAPILSIQAAENNRHYFNDTDRNITYINLSDVFEGYNGSFVLYDAAEDSWLIYNKEYATTRIPPASTFKIYSALLGLESGTITPEQSLIPWNGQNYKYDLWNADQTLVSAMQNSVTWYFQALDRQASLSSIKEYVQEIGYGNRRIEGDTSSYWINSSLKISPVEQVEMLKKLYGNQFGFSPENIKAVKDSIRLYSTEQGTISGKTGTEEVNGQNTSGWFIGYIEQDNHTYFFASNIQSEKLASGPLATELTFSILSDLELWNAYEQSGQARINSQAALSALPA